MDLVKAMYALRGQGLAPQPGLARETVSSLLRLLAPFAPHITEELWSETIGVGNVHKQPWPVFDPAAVVVDEVEIVVQINGKVRDRIVVPSGLDPRELEKRVCEVEKVQALLEGRQVAKVISVPQKLVNIVLK